jgi:hypothetical protein
VARELGTALYQRVDCCHILIRGLFARFKVTFHCPKISKLVSKSLVLMEQVFSVTVLYLGVYDCAFAGSGRIHKAHILLWVVRHRSVSNARSTLEAGPLYSALEETLQSGC